MTKRRPRLKRTPIQVLSSPPGLFSVRDSIRLLPAAIAAVDGIASRRPELLWAQDHRQLARLAHEGHALGDIAAP